MSKMMLDFHVQIAKAATKHGLGETDAVILIISSFFQNLGKGRYMYTRERLSGTPSKALSITGPCHIA
jgi:hypothetical protein